MGSGDENSKLLIVAYLSGDQPSSRSPARVTSLEQKALLRCIWCSYHWGNYRVSGDLSQQWGAETNIYTFSYLTTHFVTLYAFPSCFSLLFLLPKVTSQDKLPACKPGAQALLSGGTQAKIPALESRQVSSKTESKGKSQGDSWAGGWRARSPDRGEWRPREGRVLEISWNSIDTDLTLDRTELVENCPERLEGGNWNSTYLVRLNQRSSLLTKWWWKGCNDVLLADRAILQEGHLVTWISTLKNGHTL